MQTSGLRHCTTKCLTNTIPAKPNRIGCVHHNISACDTVTFGCGAANGVDDPEWLDTIVRKAQARCTSWKVKGCLARTCVRRPKVPLSKMIVLVLSDRGAFEGRQVIRDTWAKGHNNVYFVVGACCRLPLASRKTWTCAQNAHSTQTHSEDNSCQQIDQQLSDEFLVFGDLIYDTEVDVYRNLPYKLRAGYVWAAQHSFADWVVKVDMDSVVRVDTLEHYLTATYNSTTPVLIAAGINRGLAVPGPGGKWGEHISIKDHYKTYPPWPSGAGHVVSRPIAEYVASNTKQLLIAQGEDVSLGIWIKRAPFTTTFYASKHFIGHSGDCKDKSAWVIGHDITHKKMRECFDHMDENLR